MSYLGIPNIKVRKGSIQDIPSIPSLAECLASVNAPPPTLRAIDGWRKCKCCGDRFPRAEMTLLGISQDYVFCQACAAPRLKQRAARAAKGG